jgi:SPOR domain
MLSKKMILQRTLLTIIVLMQLNTLCFANKADTIIVQKDSRIDILQQKQLQINKRTAMLTSTGMFKGYRIQLISTVSRDDANNRKAEFLNFFPDQKAYLLYSPPTFKVRVGNFIKREEAEKFRKQLLRLYPQGVYVVQDAVEYRMKDEDELLN